MPTIRDLLGNVISFKQPVRKKAKTQPKKEPVCAEMIAIYEWLETHKCKAPFFCLMLQEGFDTSFLLNPDGQPAVFNDWEIVDQERKNMENPNIWILEVEGVPN